MLIRETKTLEDNSGLGSVSEALRARDIIKEESRRRRGTKDRWRDRTGTKSLEFGLERKESKTRTGSQFSNNFCENQSNGVPFTTTDY